MRSATCRAVTIVYLHVGKVSSAVQLISFHFTILVYVRGRSRGVKGFHGTPFARTLKLQT